ncbi:hypothetical protein EII32_08830, partial [Prevotella sp. OH937_COT-195]
MLFNDVSALDENTVADYINKNAAVMPALANNIDTGKKTLLSFMAAIISLGKYAYNRKEGVFVIPPECLTPNLSLDRICLDLPLPLRFPTALARLLTSAQPFHPD